MLFNIDAKVNELINQEDSDSPGGIWKFIIYN